MPTYFFGQDIALKIRRVLKDLVLAKIEERNKK